ncbi:N-6 DNA methylase [Marinococcus halotolerans]|uniref:N-6 DNA methylase n=1 Tax=Marinococcus halotolerans TaxID=301092 RepID=UPI000407F296|nr:N-6 DNA methylase [Marinococcus halotolerans]
MSAEELGQRNYTKNGEKFGEYEFYNIGATTIKTLREYKIIPNKSYEGVLSKKPDGLVVDRNGDNVSVILVIENKDISEFNTPEKKDKAIQQCVHDYCKPLGAKIGIVTDGEEFLWINPQKEDADYERIHREDGYDLVAEFRWSNENEISQSIDLLKKVLDDVSSTNSRLIKEVLQNPARLADRVWQTIWLASGENPDACLATFVEIFTFKYLSDLGVLVNNNLGTPISFYDVLDKERDKSLRFYENQVRSHIKELFPSSEEDGTSVINGMILDPEVLEHNLLFYKILKEFEAFGQLKAIDPEFKSRLYENFLKKSISQKNWGQFFTPRNIVKAIVEMSEIEKLGNGSKVHDPAAGVGGFVLEPIVSKRNTDFYFDANKLVSKLDYSGFDRDKKTVILAKANILLHLNELLRLNPNKTQEFAKMFNNIFKSKHTSVLGTLSTTPLEEYDLIMTNIPFVMTGTSKIKEFIKDNGILRQYYPINATGVEGLFLEHIVKSLKKNRKAYVIVPDGILNRSTDSKLRRFILDNCFLEAVISLPENAFYTTPKKTYILVLKKKEDRTVVQTDPVYSYLILNTGETLDSKRFEWDNDLPEMVRFYKYFKADKSNFECPNLQTKVWSIDKFHPDTHWSVDRWWPEEEKIELGLLEKKSLTTLNDFSDSLEEERQLLKADIEKLKEMEIGSPQPKATVTISLNDPNYFSLFIGKRVLKRDIFNISSGTIPIYSANVHEPFGSLNTSNISDFNNDFVLWGIDGNFDFNVIKRNTSFATTDHCGCIRIINNDIDAEYMYYYLNWIKTAQGLDRQLRASLRNMKKVELKFPVMVDEEGNPKILELKSPDGSSTGDFVYELDLTTQQEIAEHYRTFHEVRDSIRTRISNLTINDIPPLSF